MRDVFAQRSATMNESSSDDSNLPTPSRISGTKSFASLLNNVLTASRSAASVAQSIVSLFLLSHPALTRCLSRECHLSPCNIPLLLLLTSCLSTGSPAGRRGNSFRQPTSKRSRSKHASESPMLSEDESGGRGNPMCTVCPPLLASV